MGPLDVGDHHLHPLHRAGLGLRHAQPDRDRARGAGRRELDEAHLVAHPVVVVDGEPDLLGVERLRAIHVGDGNGHELEPPVHTPSVLATARRTCRRAPAP